MSSIYWFNNSFTQATLAGGEEHESYKKSVR